MDENNALLLLSEEYGMTIELVDDEDLKSFKKVSDSDFARLNACFRDVPQMLKTLKDAQYYSGTYKVVYDKGLGVLQKSAKDPNLFRGNIVEAGTNNKITGHALLQKINPNDFMSVSNLLMTAFSVAAVATNQYYLARIDRKLEAVEQKVDEIRQFLEIDKESKMWADGEFLKGVQNSIPFIVSNDVYRISTLTSIQSIRKDALANIKLYSEQLSRLKEQLDKNDNDNETKSNVEKYKGILPKFWYSVYLFEMAYYLEAYLSNITDEMFLDVIVKEMTEVLQMFNKGFGLINSDIVRYIDEVKALKANEIPSKMLKDIGTFLSEIKIYSLNPLAHLGAKGVGAVLNIGGDYLEKTEKEKKQIKKDDLIRSLESVIKPFSDIQPFAFQIEAVNTMNSIYNKKVEVIMKDNEAYIKFDSE